MLTLVLRSTRPIHNGRALMCNNNNAITWLVLRLVFALSYDWAQACAYMLGHVRPK